MAFIYSINSVNEVLNKIKLLDINLTLRKNYAFKRFFFSYSAIN